MTGQGLYGPSRSSGCFLSASACPAAAERRRLIDLLTTAAARVLGLNYLELEWPSFRSGIRVTPEAQEGALVCGREEAWEILRTSIYRHRIRQLYCDFFNKAFSERGRIVIDAYRNDRSMRSLSSVKSTTKKYPPLVVSSPDDTLRIVSELKCGEGTCRASAADSLPDKVDDANESPRQLTAL